MRPEAGAGETHPPKLYGELASWFHLLTAPEDYAEEADVYCRLIFEAVPSSATCERSGWSGCSTPSP